MLPTILVNYETVVKLISRTTTTTGLKVSCRLDHRKHKIGREVSAEEWVSINLFQENFHGDWNYSIRPRQKR